MLRKAWTHARATWAWRVLGVLAICAWFHSQFSGVLSAHAWCSGVLIPYILFGTRAIITNPRELLIVTHKMQSSRITLYEKKSAWQLKQNACRHYAQAIRRHTKARSMDTRLPQHSQMSSSHTPDKVDMRTQDMQLVKAGIAEDAGRGRLQIAGLHAVAPGKPGITNGVLVSTVSRAPQDAHGRPECSRSRNTFQTFSVRSDLGRRPCPLTGHLAYPTSYPQATYLMCWVSYHGLHRCCRCTYQSNMGDAPGGSASRLGNLPSPKALARRPAQSQCPELVASACEGRITASM